MTSRWVTSSPIRSSVPAREQMFRSRCAPTTGWPPPSARPRSSPSPQSYSSSPASSLPGDHVTRRTRPVRHRGRHPLRFPGLAARRAGDRPDAIPVAPLAADRFSHCLGARVGGDAPTLRPGFPHRPQVLERRRWIVPLLYLAPFVVHTVYLALTLPRATDRLESLERISTVSLLPERSPQGWWWP